MKFSYIQILVAGGWLLSIATPVVASTNYSPGQCQQIAEEIILGKRQPLTDQEMADLDPETVSRLTMELSAARHRHQSNPASEANVKLAGEGQKANPVTETNDQLQPPARDSQSINENQTSSSVDEGQTLGPLSDRQKEFINTIASDAQQVAQNHDLYASVLIAQAILESNWGRSSLAQEHHNLFGIKGYFQGMSTMMPTTENVDGQDLQIQAAFRHYPDIKASLLDYAEVLSQPLYAKVHRSFCQDYTEATSHLNGVYATDPGYQHKLNQLIATYKLTQYDEPVKTKQRPKSHGTSSMNPHQTLADQNQETQSPARTPRRQKKGLVIPLLSGVGSMSIVELIRRYIK